MSLNNIGLNTSLQPKIQNTRKNQKLKKAYWYTVGILDTIIISTILLSLLGNQKLLNYSIGFLFSL